MKESTIRAEAVHLLTEAYYKVLAINLTTDSHEEIKKSPISSSEKTSSKISECFHHFAYSNEIYIDDQEKFLRFTSLNHLRNLFDNGKTYACCHYRRKVGNDMRWVCMELIPAQEYSSRHQEIFLYIKDIHDEFISIISSKDFVTGGFNRHGFLHETKSILNNSSSEQKFALVLFDISDFKAVNEYFGTEGGDYLLHKIYKKLRSSALHPLIIGRMYGDHFLCLVEQKNVTEDTVTKLCKISFSHGEKSLNISLTCGIYNIEDTSVNVGTMCDYAELAKKSIVDLYLQPYAVFDSSMRIDYIVQSEVRGRTLKALDNNEFHVYFQPIYDARTGELASAEALIRWEYPGKGLISPAIFIPALEESGHISKLDHFVANHVAQFLKDRADQGKTTIPISVNLSWMDFYDKNMINSILVEVRNNKNPNVLPRFEITETSYAALHGQHNNMITALQEAGGKVLLDDFGSGYSSFSTLRDYNFDIAKLDMGFIQQLGKGNQIKSIIHSIIDMFHHMNVKVIAEGVETEAQLDFLRRHGCDYIQGYYFSKPLPQDEFEKLLDENKKKEIPVISLVDMKLTDLIPRDILQELQDSFSHMTGMAAITTDRNGVPVTNPSNFTDFCTKYIRGTKEGLNRCNKCDTEGARKSLQEGNVYCYECHAGLLDYAAPIMVNGELVGRFLGGQILSKKPDPEHYRTLAEELNLDPGAFLDSLKSITIMEQEKIDQAAQFFFTTANMISEIAYNRHMLQRKNIELESTIEK